jgi:serine/threonine-protein kinase OSR1/STK39
VTVRRKFFVIEFYPSPTAQELLETPFFKASKKKYYLVGAILSVYSLVGLVTGLILTTRTEDLPPLSERQERRAAHHPQALHIVDSWDFATTLSPGVAYEQRAEAGSSSRADYSQASDGVFEIEDDPVRQEERHKARIPKGISWAQESDLAPVQDELEPPETDIQSPSDLSDSDAADPQASRSPSTSATDDDSSPPSSFPDPTSIPNPRILLAQPIDVLPMNKPPHERELSAAGPSLRVFPPTSTSSPNLRPLSSSASQVGLWQKFKSNVRRPSTRDGPSSVS